MVLDYKGKDDIGNWTCINYLQYVQSRWGLRTPSMLRAGYPTLLTWRGRYDLTQDQQVVTTRSPRIVTECLLTRSMLIKMYVYAIYSRFRIGTICLSEGMGMSLSLHYHYRIWWVLSALAVSSVLLTLITIYSIVHILRCPRQTQHLQFETSFRPEDHTDWEIAPPSYDLKSWWSLDLEWTIFLLFTHMNHLK